MLACMLHRLDNTAHDMYMLLVHVQEMVNQNMAQDIKCSNLHVALVHVYTRTVGLCMDWQQNNYCTHVIYNITRFMHCMCTPTQGLRPLLCSKSMCDTHAHVFVLYMYTCMLNLRIYSNRPPMSTNTATKKAGTKSIIQ